MKQSSVDYVRDGVRCYISLTLRKELYVTDGILYKEPQLKGITSYFKALQYKLFVAIDFKNNLLRFKESGLEDEQYITKSFKKDMPFIEVIDVQSMDIDIFKGEHKMVDTMPHRAKFSVKTL